MRITNKNNLPATLLKALSYNGHVKADYSVTELLQPPQLLALRKAHEDDIEEDAAERVWSLLGSAVHSVLEKGEEKHTLVEEYLTTEIGGKTISGKPDLYEDGVIWDYKITSAYAILYGDRKDDWVKQLNMYAQLYRQAGFEVKGLKVLAILRDWSKSKALAGGNYPQSNIVVIDIPLMPSEAVSILMTSLLIEHEADPRPCTDAERWAKADVFAVMKEGRKSAVKLFDDEKTAQLFAAPLTGHSVVKRPGGFTRCEDYCPVSQFCKQNKGVIK